MASNFPLHRQVVEQSHCGLTVDALKPPEIARAMDWLIEPPDGARRMGEDGRQAVLDRYNWEKESEKLLGI